MTPDLARFTRLVRRNPKGLAVERPSVWLCELALGGSFRLLRRFAAPRGRPSVTSPEGTSAFRRCFRNLVLALDGPFAVPSSTSRSAVAVVVGSTSQPRSTSVSSTARRPPMRRTALPRWAPGWRASGCSRSGRFEIR